MALTTAESGLDSAITERIRICLDLNEPAPPHRFMETIGQIRVAWELSVHQMANRLDLSWKNLKRAEPAKLGD